MSQTTKTWTRSSFCSDGACVEVADESDFVALRDGKNLHVEEIRVPLPVWNSFVQGIVEGDYPA